MFFKHFVSENQLSGLFVSGTLVEICSMLEPKIGDNSFFQYSVCKVSQKTFQKFNPFLATGQKSRGFLMFSGGIERNQWKPVKWESSIKLCRDLCKGQTNYPSSPYFFN